MGKSAINPAELLQSAALNAHKVADEQALAIASNWVQAKIRADQVKSNAEAVGAFKQIVAEVQPFLKERLMQQAAALINASIPSEPSEPQPRPAEQK